MLISVEELLTDRGVDPVVTRLLATLARIGFPVTSWGKRSVARALVQAFAEELADAWGEVGAIIASGFISRASGQWLELLAAEFYGLQRNLGISTVRTISLTSVASAPMYTFAAGGLIARSSTGELFLNVDPVSLSPGATWSGSWQAQDPGEAGNVGGESITDLVTPLPGVTVSSASGISGITVQGTDDETDDDYRARCRAQWSTLGAGGSADAIAYHCRTASAQVTRVKVYEHTPTDGAVTIVLAGPAGGVTPDVVSTCVTYLEAGRRAQCVTFVVDAADNLTITVTGSVYVKPASLAAAKAYVAAQFAALQASTDSGSIVDVANLIRIVRSAPGVTHVALTSPAADVALAAMQVPVLVEALTWLTS